MKSFFKYLLATVVGVILSSVILFFLFFGIVSAIISSQDKPVEIKKNSILYLKLDKQITDRKPSTPFNLKSLSKDDRMGLNEILENIEKAKTDDNISGIYIEPGYHFAGLATTEEIRDALLDFRTSGKFVISYCNGIFSQSALYLASASDKIFFNPTGIMMVNGISLQTMHLKNTMEKLDIKTTVIKVGEYKGAGEMLESDKMSKYNREQLERIANTVWLNIADGISEARGISVDSLNYLVNNLGISEPKDALKYNLVDSLIYKGDVINYLKALTNTPDKKDLNAVKLSEYNKVPKNKNYKGLAKDKIAVIYASGGIVDGEGDENNIGGEKYAQAVREARRDSSIKAIVLRINSGGGSAMASEDILVELLKTKDIKPIIVSMGDVAASGGYYIACAADTILAGKNTITGSIGVIGAFFNAEGFFKKLGITFDVAKSHQYSDFLSQVKPLSIKEKDFLENYIHITYDQFITHVADGRDMTKERVNEIGRGHVYGGVDAVDIDLVDGYGGLNDAIKIAHEMAGLGEKYRLVELPKQPNAIEQFVTEITGDAKVKSMLEPFGIDISTFNEIKDILQTQGVIVRMPFMISFN
jgi:protease IV